MPLIHRLASGAAIGVALIAAAPAGAETAPVSKQIDALQSQIQALQQQLIDLQKQVKESQDTAAKAQSSAAAAFDVLRPMAAAKPAEPKVIQSANNQFGLSSADGKNTIELTGRVHIDYGDYLNYSPAHRGVTTPNDLNSGVNFRRARLGVTGKFMGDWNYTFIADLGGSSDTFNPLNGSNSNSGIENAFIQYTGFKPLIVTLGAVDTNWTLDESISSNQILFMERDTTQQIVSNIMGGDNRLVFGANWNTDRAWVGAFLTGPQTGAPHGSTVTSTTAPTITCVAGKTATSAPTCTNSSTTQTIGGSAEQTGAVARASFQVLQAADYSVHLGIDGGYLFQPPHAAGVRSITLSDRPELRVDPTSLVSTGAITRVSSVGVIGGEAAAVFGPFYAQGEYYSIDVNRDSGAPGGDYSFNGGYVEAAYSITGESRKYNPATGAYSDLIPDHPVAYADGNFGGYGAWEAGLRFSAVNLNDNFRVPNLSSDPGIEGGDEKLYTAGLNWYVNRNIKFLFNYIHGEVQKTNPTATNLLTNYKVGQNFDAVAARAQFVW